MAGKKFAAEFALRRNVSAQDKILIQDSDDDVVKYAYPPQIASLSGYAYAQSVADLPLLPSNKSIGYIVGQMLYIYVGMGGDTKDGLYQSVGFFVGPQGVQGEKGEKGEQGEQGVQGPKGDNGGLSLQELDDYLATKQYVTGDTLADMLTGYVSNTSLMRDYVTIAKTQDVTGVKNFTAGVQFDGVPMYKSKGDTVFLDGNLVVRGAVTMYGMNTTTSPSIFSALPIDGKTIGRNERGELYVIGGGGSGGGGVADSIAWSNVTNKPTWITDTKPKYSYSEILDTPDLSVKADKATTLAGYGITNAYTKSEVNNIIDSLDDTYVTIAGEGQGIIAEHNFINGFKVGGLPIYRSKDDTVYLDANLVVRGGVTMYGSNLTTSPSIFAALPIDNDTIKRNAKGELYAVGGGSSGTGGGISIADVESYLTTNGYATQSWVTGKGYITGITGTMVTNALGYTPFSASGGNVNGSINLAGDYDLNMEGYNVVSRYLSNYFLCDSAIERGFNTFVVGKKINFQTSATTTKFTTATLDENGNFSITGMLKLPAVDSGFTNPRITFGDSVIRIGATTAGLLGVYASGDIRLNPNSASSANSTMGLWLKASGFNGINISNPTQALHVNGKGIFADATNPWVALQRNGENWYLQVVSTGLKIGKTSALGILVDASGNLQTPGAITMYYSSDKRLKHNIRKVDASKTLMSLGGIYQYEYIDSEVQKNSTYGGSHYGLIYQNVKGTALDKMCFEREDGMGALNYLDTNFISLIAGATMENISEVEKLKRKIRHLEAKVKQLEKRVA